MRTVKADTMKTWAFYLGTLLLTFHCAVWIAVAPLVPRLHQAFAHHHHVFCLEHHRIEDAELKDRRLSISETFTSVVTQKNNVSGVDRRPACFFSNILIQQADRTTPTHRSASVLIEEQEVQADTGVDIPAIDIFLIAPKHSPPFTA